MILDSAINNISIMIIMYVLKFLIFRINSKQSSESFKYSYETRTRGALSENAINTDN